MDEVLALDIPDLNARAQRKAHFQHGVLQCLEAASTKASTEALRFCLESVLVQWYRMDAGQQQSWQDLFLLMAALAHHKVGVEVAPQAWQEQLERVRQQRQGRMPQWMLDAATRCGFVLGL